MKQRTLITALAMTAAVTALPIMPVQAASGPGTSTQNVVAAVTSTDAETLAWMREEEKLARDVYLNLYKRWKKPVFNNIAASEQRHFDAIGAKLDQFGLPDPALPGIGQFSNGELQALYDQLLAEGRKSYAKALWVGATIEDMDIRDLQAAIEATSVPSLKTTYGNLLEGSKNHLRSLVGLLTKTGISYEPQYTDPALYDAILGY